MKVVVLALVTIFSSISASAQNDNWKEHLRWSANNTGVADCEEQYKHLGQEAGECAIVGAGARVRDMGIGNRKCLIAVARKTAANGQCGLAFSMALTTQCHNGAAQQELQAAGSEAVCNWLQGK